MKRLLILILLVLVAAPAFGQRNRYRSSRLESDTRGFSLGLFLQGASWQREDVGDDDDWEGGGGAGLTLAYGFNHTVTAYVSANGSVIDPDFGDEYSLGHVDLGVLLHLASPRQPFRPYFDLALTGRAAEYEIGPADVEVSGGGFTFGGGLKWFPSRPVALDLGLKITVGELERIEVGDLDRDIEVDATSSRLHLGITWYPQR